MDQNILHSVSSLKPINLSLSSCHRPCSYTVEYIDDNLITGSISCNITTHQKMYLFFFFYFTLFSACSITCVTLHAGETISCII